MKVYTFSEAQQNLAFLLDEAQRDGAVQIRRRDGQTFIIRPEPSSGSPLDVEGVDLNVTTEEIVAFVRAGRERLRTVSKPHDL